ncbi:type A2 lanthipeptide, partial [Streptococcus agalactiae]
MPHVAHKLRNFRKRKTIEKETTIIESIQEVSLEELDQIIGAG